MSFKALLDELEVMTKALPAEGDAAGDKKIAAAAAEGADGDGKKKPAEAEGAGEGETKVEDEEAAGEGEMAKSFKLKLEDGSEIDAMDGTALIKALTMRVETNENEAKAALTMAIGLIKGQGAMIKSLTDKVEKLSNTGKGRKAVVTIAEKPAAEKTVEAEGVQIQDFMAKAHVVWSAGKLSGDEFRRLEFLRESRPTASRGDRLQGAGLTAANRQSHRRW